MTKSEHGDDRLLVATIPTRVASRFEGKDGQIVLDQNRTLDKSRLMKKLRKIGVDAQNDVLIVFREMFAE